MNGNRGLVAKHPLLALAVLLVTCLAPVAVAAGKEKPPKGMGKYIMVLSQSGDVSLSRSKPRPPKKIVEPDITKLNGRVLDRQGDMIIMFLPLTTARKLRADENVAYLQRVWMGETGEDLLEPVELDSSVGPSVTTDSETDLTWSSGTFEYDGSGNIKKMGADTYTYDSVGRIATASVNGTTETYRYDSFGNLLEKTVSGTAPLVIPVDSGSNRILGEEYDVAGNVLTNSRAKPSAYIYDSMGLISEVSGGIVHRRMIYTADDERIRVTRGAGEHRWTFRDLQGRVLREFTGPSTTWLWREDHFYAEGRAVAEERNEYDGGRIHFHTDHLGSTRMTTMEDRMRLGRHDYLPFGNEQTSTAQEAVNFGKPPEATKFTGHQRDYMGTHNVENADYLDYMHARYYNPMLGRFLSVDPIMTVDALRSPQLWNRYAYVGNNPMNRTDPTGKILQFSGDAEDLKKVSQIADSGLNGYRLDINSKGVASLVKAKANGAETKEQAALRKALQKVIGDSATTSITADSGANNVTIGSLSQRTIDPGDMQKYGANQPSSSSSLLGHEIMEQYGSQVGKMRDPHAFGMQQEGVFSGWTRGAQSNPVFANGLWSVTVTFTRGKSTTDVRTTIDPRTDDVTSVVRTPRP